jgi:hypothetical protein
LTWRHFDMMCLNSRGFFNSAVLLACINSNSFKACSIVSLLAFRLAPVLCSPCSCSDVRAAGRAGGNEVRGDSKVGLFRKEGPGVEGERLFWGQRLEMFLESGEEIFLGSGSGNWGRKCSGNWGRKISGWCFWVVLSMPSSGASGWCYPCLQVHSFRQVQLLEQHL